MDTGPKLKNISDQNNDGTSDTIWKLSSIAWHSIFIVALVSLFIFIVSKRSIYDELEYIIIIVAIILFVFLSYGLFVGARLKGKPKTPKFTFLKKLFDVSFDLDAFDLFGDFEPLAWIGVTIFAIALLLFLTTAVWSAVIGLIFIFYWIVYRAVRLVLLKGSKCKGNLVLSIKFSLFNTILYSGWIFGIVWIVEHKPWKYFNL
jgi:hypothetical protein